MIFVKKKSKENKQNLYLKEKIHPNSYVKSVLDLYSQIDDQTRKIHCNKNCVYCCNDYFYVTEREFYVILLFLFENYSDIQILDFVENAKAQKDSLKKLYPDEYEYIKLRAKGNVQLINLEHDTSNIHLDCSCPFLLQNRCAVYSVRPIVCRIYGCFNELKCPKISYYRNGDLSLEVQNQIKVLTFLKNQFRFPYPLCYWFDNANEIMLIKMFRLKSSYKYDENNFLD